MFPPVSKQMKCLLSLKQHTFSLVLTYINTYKRVHIYIYFCSRSAKAFGFFSVFVFIVKLQSIWSQMKYHYHNLVHRQILHKERFTTKWEHFEPMSFMYNITVAKIVGASGSSGNDHAEIPECLPTPPPLPQSQGRGRPSGSFTWLPPVAPQAEISVETTPFTGFTGLVPPAAVTVETTTTPLRKPGRPGSLNNSMRGRIIDAIKNRPILWAGRQKDVKQGQNRTSAVWKEVAVELGLTPSEYEKSSAHKQTFLLYTFVYTLANASVT